MTKQLNNVSCKGPSQPWGRKLTIQNTFNFKRRLCYNSLLPLLGVSSGVVFGCFPELAVLFLPMAHDSVFIFMGRGPHVAMATQYARNNAHLGL